MILVVVSTGHFDPLLSACSRLYPRFAFEGQIGSSRVIPPFPWKRTVTPEALRRWMQSAELVVTHAGTGMLSMLYEMGKRSVVIPKQRRYGEANDGQVELARKWDALGLGVLCVDVDGLESAIQTCRQRPLPHVTFPSLGGALASHLSDRIALAPVRWAEAAI